jgi:hypothetical protein
MIYDEVNNYINVGNGRFEMIECNFDAVSILQHHNGNKNKWMSLVYMVGQSNLPDTTVYNYKIQVSSIGARLIILL